MLMLLVQAMDHTLRTTDRTDQGEVTQGTAMQGELWGPWLCHRCVLV